MSVLLTICVILLLLWKYMTTEKLVLKRTAQLSFQAQLMKQVGEAVIPIDRNGLILDWNKGAEKLFGYRMNEITGLSVYSLLNKVQVEQFKKIWLPQTESGSLNNRFDLQPIRKDGSHFDGVLSLSVMLNEKHDTSGFICIVSDNTERKALAEKKDCLIKELRTALEEIKTLKGLIPICASCKKIRDDKGYWNQLETYIGDHSEATFSHGICPDCADKLYGYKVSSQDVLEDSKCFCDDQIISDKEKKLPPE
ncbi:MAG: PAS domain-containing protein, partial [Spirochaetales bacterium]|nr:PAS domain-containing protein [Spirochaetales bacterium]